MEKNQPDKIKIGVDATFLQSWSIATQGKCIDNFGSPRNIPFCSCVFPTLIKALKMGYITFYVPPCLVQHFNAAIESETCISNGSKRKYEYALLVKKFVENNPQYFKIASAQKTSPETLLQQSIDLAKQYPLWTHAPIDVVTRNLRVINVAQNALMGMNTISINKFLTEYRYDTPPQNTFVSYEIQKINTKELGNNCTVYHAKNFSTALRQKFFEQFEEADINKKHTPVKSKMIAKVLYPDVQQSSEREI